MSRRNQRARSDSDVYQPSTPPSTESDTDFEDGASIFDNMTEDDYTKIEESVRQPRPYGVQGPAVVYAEAPNGFNETPEQELINDLTRGCVRDVPDNGKDYYIVQCGRICGVFNDWLSAQGQTSGHPHCALKKANPNTKAGAYREWDRLYAEGLVGGPGANYMRIPPYFEGQDPPAPVGGRSSQAPHSERATRTPFSPASASSTRGAQSQPPRSPTRPRQEAHSASQGSFFTYGANERVPSTPRSSNKAYSSHSSNTPTSSRFTASSSYSSTPPTGGPSKPRSQNKEKWRVKLEPHVNVVLFFVVPSSARDVVFFNYFEAKAASRREGGDIRCFDDLEQAQAALIKYMRKRDAGL